uniref:Putative secreted protein n=1 Tax=Panstrongylus lignarius TaxID=156445 RepID=A0A224XWH1_9HEMI
MVFWPAATATTAATSSSASPPSATTTTTTSPTTIRYNHQYTKQRRLCDSEQFKWCSWRIACTLPPSPWQQPGHIAMSLVH